jgi:hypothetical protein
VQSYKARVKGGDSVGPGKEKYGKESKDKGGPAQEYALTGKEPKSNRDCLFWSGNGNERGGRVERLP